MPPSTPLTPPVSAGLRPGLHLSPTPLHQPILPCHQQEAGLMRCTWPPAAGQNRSVSISSVANKPQKNSLQTKLSTKALCLERSFPFKLGGSQFPGLSPTPQFPFEKGCGRPRKEEGRRPPSISLTPPSFPFSPSFPLTGSVAAVVLLFKNLQSPPSHLLPESGAWLCWCYVSDGISDMRVSLHVKPLVLA